MTLTCLTRQCYPQSHTDHQTTPNRLPNSTKRDQKIPVVGMRVGVCVCVREVRCPVLLVTGASRSFLERRRREMRGLPSVKEGGKPWRALASSWLSIAVIGQRGRERPELKPPSQSQRAHPQCQTFRGREQPELKPPRSQRAHPQCQTFCPEFCSGLQQASAPTSTTVIS